MEYNRTVSGGTCVKCGNELEPWTNWYYINSFGPVCGECFFPRWSILPPNEIWNPATFFNFKGEEDKMSDELIKKDISGEAWREYEWTYIVDGMPYPRNYKIDYPQNLYYRVGGTTHRVTDEFGIAHCIPAPGQFGCVLRWKNKEGIPEVQF